MREQNDTKITNCIQPQPLTPEPDRRFVRAARDHTCNGICLDCRGTPFDFDAPSTKMEMQFNVPTRWIVIERC